MKLTKSNYSSSLLPIYFKVVGILVIALALLGTAFIRPYIQPNHYQLARTVTFNMIILGLFFIAWSRDKIEDEMSLHLRFQAMGGAFGFGVMFCMFHPLVAFLLSSPDLDIQGQQPIMSMLLFFIIIYTIMKRSNK
jgi:hypothetical protein